jgi:hypothetical protein
MLSIPFIRPVIILAFFGGALNFVWFFSSKQGAERADAGLRQRTEELRALRGRAAARQAAAVKEFERRADAIIARVYREEDWRVAAATDKLTGWGDSAYLSYLFAYDAVAGSSTAGDFIGDVVSPVFGCALGRALGSLHQEFEVMSTELGTTAMEYNLARQRILGEISPSAQGADFSGLPEPMLPVREAGETAMKTTINVGALAVDAVRLPALISSTKVVLDAVIARITATMASSGTLVVADGPLPVGDVAAVVVGVGGGIWAARDLCNAHTQLVPAVRAKLEEQYRAQEKSLRKIAVAQACQLLKTYETAQNPKPEPDRRKL